MSILGYKPVSFPKPKINFLKPSIPSPINPLLRKPTTSGIVKYANAIVYGRSDYQPKARQILLDYGKKIITAMEVRREPLPLALNVALNVATLGEIAKNNPYDDLFHLSIVVKLDDATQVLMEKNEVISLELNPYPRPKTDSKEVNLRGKVITLQQLLNNTQERMGGNYFIYSARNNNCQDFILNILVANGLDTPELVDFVKQDTIRVFGDMVRFRKFSNTLTDIASRFNVIKEGYGEEEPNLEVGEKISLNNGLSNYDIEEILGNSAPRAHSVSCGRSGDHKGACAPYFNGVYSKDQLPRPIKNGWYIINLQNWADGGGTHWTCFYIKNNGKHIDYYDPFGFPPPVEVMQLAKGSINWSSKQIQDERSTACGWYCIARVASRLSFQKFIDKFSDNNDINDRVLKNMLQKQGLIA